MPRKPRLFLPEVPVHAIQRGNNRQAIFFDDSDYIAYLDWLNEAAKRYGCTVHAYVLMTNHVHLLMTPAAKDSISQVMQDVGRRYVPYVNHTYGRTGTLWEGRYKASLVQNEGYLLSCMRYIELNPVRANMVKEPGGYRWSSYGCNALGKQSTILSHHASYIGLGITPKKREGVYRSLFESHLDAEMLNKIRASWQSGMPYGNDRFRGEMERALGVRFGQGKRGRPKKGSDPF